MAAPVDAAHIEHDVCTRLMMMAVGTVDEGRKGAEEGLRICQAEVSLMSQTIMVQAFEMGSE